MAPSIMLGDCLDRLKSIESSSVDLVYLDPPFFSKKVHKLTTRDRSREYSFTDLWTSHEEYLVFLQERLLEMHRILKDSGSIFFHCDRNASHLIRMLLDKIFCNNNFRSEIIWFYKRWSNSQNTLLPSHQTIFFYSKSEDYKFNRLYEGYSPATNIDQIFQRRERDNHGKSIYARNKDGSVISNGPKKGVLLGDVWDIPYLNPKAKERVGYPTQKPILLLERIINLVTDQGDIVVDPFCGSGTTLVAADMLGRECCGIDISEEAISVTKNRLKNPSKTRSTLLEKGRESYIGTNKSLLNVLGDIDYVPVHRNKGIDAFLREQFEGEAVPIRIQRPGEELNQAMKLLIKAGRKKNAKLMFLVVNDAGSQSTTYSGFSSENVILVTSPKTQILSAIVATRSEVNSGPTDKDNGGTRPSNAQNTRQSLVRNSNSPKQKSLF